MKKPVALGIAGIIFAVAAAFMTVDISYAGVQTCTWTGGGTNDNWSTAANWSCDTGTVPADGGELIFPAVGTNILAVNDLAATNTYSGMLFSGGASCVGSQTIPYKLSGNNLKLAGDISVAYSGNCFANVSITNNITLTADAVFSVTDKGAGSDSLTLGDSTYLAEVHPNLSIANHAVTLKGASVLSNISGTGDLFVENRIGAVSYHTTQLDGDNSNFLGDITVRSGGTLQAAMDRDTLGMNYGETTVNDSAVIEFISGTRHNNASSTTATLSEDITLLGQGTASGWNSKLRVGDASYNYPYGYQAVADSFDNGFTLIYTGTLTLNQNTTVNPLAESFTITGPIVGNYTLSIDSRSTSGVGAFIINSSSNGSATPNGNYTHAHYSTTFSDAVPSQHLYVTYGHIAIVDGVRGDIILNDGGVLKGEGTVGTIGVASVATGSTSGGRIAAGNSPGILNSGSVTLDTNSFMEAEIGGTAAGEFDQLNVTGTVNLGSATLQTTLYNGYEPALNTTYTIVNNDGSDAIAGTFAGLAQGASFAIGEYTFTISYTGGTGNDVVLTVTAVPEPPDTAGVIASPTNIFLGGLVIAIGIALIVIRRVMTAKVAQK